MLRLLNTRILASLAMIVFVGAAYAGATGAFFSDEENSTGNTFTAGAIDLRIDSVAHYNGMVCAAIGEGEYVWLPDGSVTLNGDNQPTIIDEGMNSPEEWTEYNTENPLQYPQAGVECTGTWPLANDGENTLSVGTFFNFDDIKPGDQGENTISIHIDSNDAWMCVDLANVAGADPVETMTEPEDEIDDTFGNTLADSELPENLHFFAWVDPNGNNVFEDGEQSLGQASADDLVNQTWALADSTTGTGPIQGGETGYIGVYWCAGDITVSGNDLSCDGEGMGNEAQTDSWSADLRFYVEQARNNEDFVCNPTTEPGEGAVMLDKIVTFTSAPLEGVDPSDYTLHLVGPGGDHILTDEVEFGGLTAGVYTVSEVYSGNPANATSTATFSGSCSEIGATDTATLTVVANATTTCTITNSVSLIAS